MSQDSDDNRFAQALVRSVGGVFFAMCDAVDPGTAARAVERLRDFADRSADNRDVVEICHAMATAQDRALRSENYDFRKELRPGVA